MLLLAEDGRVPTGLTERTEHRFLPTETWSAHKETLADSLTDDEWRVLPMLFHNAESLRFELLTREPGEPISERYVAGAELTRPPPDARLPLASFRQLSLDSWR